MRDGYALVPGVASNPELDAAPPVRPGGVWDPQTRFIEPASRLTGRTLDTRYLLGELIGSGGMAFVYRATDEETGETVAVKVLTSRLAADPESIARLRREAALAMRLDHPGVCHIVAAGSDRGLHYLVMPLLIGESLAAREGRECPLPIAEVLDILAQLCAGLQHAHDRGVLHRDLKPENVMLIPGNDGVRAVIMDFGLAKPAPSETEQQKITDTGVILGTPEFMSPEQIRGFPIDSRSDQYALAVLAFELLTGELPFDGGTSQETMLHRLTDTPLRLRDRRPEVPEWLDAAIARALSREPAERFPNVKALGEALGSEK
ncbi:MAG: serine/threonine-protein kinase [Gemmatimonadota bacterium]|nr:serine/threonine-protein kinase [Gemmatimonadota bacterium]